MRQQYFEDFFFNPIGCLESVPPTLACVSTSLFLRGVDSDGLERRWN